MERYDSYKDSGVDWLGEIPAHWDVRRNRFIFREFNERSTSGDETHLSMSQRYGLVPASQLDTQTLQSESYDGAKLCRTGDLVQNRLKAHLAVFGVSPCDGLVSPDYSVFRLRDGRHQPTYFERLFKTPEYLSEFNRRVRGIVVGFLRLYSEDFMSIPALLPPLEDQERIVAFLDQKTAEIDAAIAKKERLIELLQEQKSILINQAVTRGLNPDVPLRDSGVEWIGQIPAHWGLQRFKLCVSITSGQVDPTKKQYSSLPLIAPNHIESGTGRLLAIESADDQGADSGKYSVAAGDLLYSKIRPALRKACISPVDGLCSADMYVLRPKPQLDKSYLLGFILTDAFTLPALDAALRVAMPKVNREAMGDFPLLLPPIEEQQKIVSYLNELSQKFDSVVEKAAVGISNFQEIKSVLIASAVTGKIKV